MAYLDKTLHYGLIAVAFSLPIIRLNHITEYVFLSLLALWIGRQLFTQSLALNRTALDIPIVIFFCWVLLTVPFSTDWLYSLKEWQKSIPRFLIFWFVVSVAKTQKDTRTILHSFSIGLVLLTLLESVHFFTEGGEALSMERRAGEFTGSSQWMSCFLVMGIPVLWLGLMSETRNWIRTFYLSALAMSGAALFLVHTRAAWVAVSMQALFYGVLRLTKSWVVSGVAVFLAVGLLILFLSLPGQYRELISSSEFTSPRSMLLRFNTWELAVNDIREHPVTGIGYGKHSFHLKHPDLGDSYHTHIHNFFLSSAVQIGIPGVLLVIWIFGTVLQKTYEWGKTFSDQYFGKLSLAIFLMTVGLMVRNLFDDMVIGSVVYLYMLLVGIGFGQGVYFQARQKANAVVGRKEVGDAHST